MIRLDGSRLSAMELHQVAVGGEAVCAEPAALEAMFENFKWSRKARVSLKPSEKFWSVLVHCLWIEMS